ncbi:STAS domain-containing protein [Tautonia sp. JC769]|uniref:STAS domain-containing protein n=1 Tax=Tautonia sp. JC769 TaxID=3232135 RepID=UPI003457DA0D
MMDCARTSTARLAGRGPEEVRAQDSRDREADRLVEDWITSRIDGVGRRQGPAPGPSSSPVGSPVRRVPGQSPPDARQSPRQQGWKRLRPEHRGDLTVVHLLDGQLIHEGPLAELRGELRDLSAAGCSRIVLNLAKVEQVSSQFLEIVTTLDRLCSARPGGCLKLCKVGEDVRRLIELCGLERYFKVEPDLQSALDGPWPTPGELVPRELLDCLDERSAPRPPVERSTGQGVEARAPGPSGFLTIRRDGNVLGTLRIPEQGLRIGRDAPCELRLRHRSVSRVHAWIGRRDGGFWLDDLGSSNGTMVEGTLIRSSSSLLEGLASFAIGPYQLELSRSGGMPAGAGRPAGSPDPEGGRESPIWEATGDPETPEATSTQVDASAPEGVRLERINDVLVLSPVVSQLDREEAIEALRESLDGLMRRPDAAVNVVMNLAPVACLSGRAIGVIMAHHLKLRRQGGGLRLAQPAPAVRVALEVVGLQSLIEMFPSLDEAVLDAWPR